MPEEVEVVGEYKPKSVILQDTISQMWDNKEISNHFHPSTSEPTTSQMRILDPKLTIDEDVTNFYQIDHLQNSISQIPIRPSWGKSIRKADELNKLEHDEFMKWRKKIHLYSPIMILTLSF